MKKSTLSNPIPVEPQDVEVDAMLQEQAAQLEGLLPVIHRKLFTLVPDHPVADMPMAQLRTCSILQSGPRTMSSLSEELGITVSAMTQIADRMEKAGLVERILTPEDRRQKLLQLSEHGAAIMKSRKQIRIRQAAQALELVPEELRNELLKSLHVLLTAAVAISPTSRQEDPIGVRQEH